MKRAQARVRRVGLTGWPAALLLVVGLAPGILGGDRVGMADSSR